jgi:hypothetical protein
VGWSSQAVTAIEFVGEDFVINQNGAFFYDGAPGPGTLSISIAQFPGTDQYGNGYPSGVCTFLPGVGTSELGEGSVGVIDQYGNSWTWVPLPQPSSSDPAYLALIAPDGITQLYVDSGGFLHANEPTNPVSETPETWHDMTLQHGWTVQSGSYARYQLMPDNTVIIQGRILAGDTANATVIWTAPAGYVPARSQSMPFIIEQNSGGGSAIVDSPYLFIEITTGNLIIQNVSAAATDCSFNARYALD